LKIGKIPKSIYMKTYYSNQAHFMGDGLEELDNFNIYGGTDLIEMLHTNVTTVIDASTTPNIDYNLEKSRYKAENDNQKQTSSSKFTQLTIETPPTSKEFYYNQGDIRLYSLTPIAKDVNNLRNTWKPKNTISSKLIKESTIRDISTIDSFVYFTFPHKFINENLSQTLASTDLENTRLWYDLIKHNLTIENMIKAKDIVDSIHSKTKKHPNGGNEYTPVDIYKWRFDLSFGMVYSIKKYGYYNPVINSSRQMFFDGTHRLGYGAMVEKDVPYLQILPHSKDIKPNDSFFTFTPPFFRNNEHAIFLFDIKNKKIQVYFIKTNILKKSITWPVKSHIEARFSDKILFDNIVTAHIKKNNPDCEIVINPIGPKPKPIVEVKKPTNQLI